MILTKDFHMFLKASFKDENEIENVVLENYQQLFGEYSLLLPKSKVNTIGGKGTIPDGILINFETEEWFIIEVERAIHGTWEHIAPQISKQITAFSNSETEDKIIKMCLDEIMHDKNFIELLEEINIKAIKIHSKLIEIFHKLPIIALPIDDIPSDLIDWAKTLRNEVRIWKVEKYIDDSNEIMYTLPDDAIPNFITRTIQNGTISVSDDDKVDPFTLLINSGELKIGSQLYFDYGPKGAKKTHFIGVVHKDGIEVDGVVLSPSAVAG